MVYISKAQTRALYRRIGNRFFTNPHAFGAAIIELGGDGADVAWERAADLFDRIKSTKPTELAKCNDTTLALLCALAAGVRGGIPRTIAQENQKYYVVVMGERMRMRFQNRARAMGYSATADQIGELLDTYSTALEGLSRAGRKPTTQDDDRLVDGIIREAMNSALAG